MNPIIIIPDGVGVRNFVLGSFLPMVSRESKASVLHVIPEDLLPTYAEGMNGDVLWQPLVKYEETFAATVLRYALAYAQMYWGDTQAMRFSRTKPLKGSWRRRAVHRVARLLGRVSASPRGLRRLERWHCRQVSRVPQVPHYRRLFENIKPSVLLCSHQRPLEILPAVMAARELEIPTATFIFSWDNLTSKGRIAAPFDYFLVWSNLMREELLQYYPDVTAERVHVVGTPQFDPYADDDLSWTRDEFFRRIGADPSEPLLCYSGGDIGTCPEDQLHVGVLMELIREGRIVGNPRVLLRPAPVDEGNRFAGIRHRFPELIYAPPTWIHVDPGKWSRVIPQHEDVQFLANLTQHADVNINVASTMTLDFAIHDRPVVNIAFDVTNPPPHGTPLWDFFYRFEHYRPVVEIGAARFARSREELAEHVNAYLEDPSLDREARRRFVELEVGVPLGQSSERIVKVLRAISRRQH